MSLPFTPKFPHPFTFDEILELEVPIIAAEVTRLGNSISRLKDSNDQIRAHVESLTEPDDAEEAAEMQDVITENEETINAQEERVLMLKHALEAKMGFDPTNSHYGIDENKAVINTDSAPASVPPHPETSRNDPPPNPAENQDEGMYL